ncbi:threonine aldolase family protein [Nitratireductor pacificus]|uniref:L-threonine aldolase n=1 Tax=Nitratireductor pacificus pht-3B TaxID=391937 RepID=K2MDI3_9HYPH|nr:aminotransferase class I/II-fold pyridoxal phosphate-dependent enzyme [Nitratireductor pacificus]EKF18850.1 L-threonine aldolase [Nitratireductor pacificus pht-3B]
MISLVDDAALLSPKEMAERLASLTSDGKTVSDYYGNGGAVEAFEARIAAHLGKERAVVFPTGTLANLCAMRLLAGTDNARILVHRDGHFFNDAGDNLAALGRFTMVPLAGEGAGFEAADVEHEIARAASARVAARIGCIAIESPSRRIDGRRFGSGRIAAIAEVAREHGVPMFLDGARMLIECAVTGQSPADMAAPFDLVYLSLYKYLDAPFGCVLAGEAALLDDVYHQRRAYGGGLWQMWPAAVMAQDKLSRFDALWAEVVRHVEAVFAAMEGGPVAVERFADGTNAVRLILPRAPGDPAAFAARAQRLGLKLPPLAGDRMTVKFNESWLAAEPAALARKLRELAE